MMRTAGGTVGIMQPYLFPYIGYFQLIHCVDRFVVYDRIEYSKAGWFNRNRILQNGEPSFFTVPLAKASDFASVHERRLAEGFPKERTKLLNRLRGAYARAPHLRPTLDLVERCLTFEDDNFFSFTFHALQETCRHIGIGTELVPSSRIEGEPSLKGQDRVIRLCELAGASRYINPIGGVELYDRESFAAHSIELRFLQPSIQPYTQFGDTFVGYLSIIDVMMFNDLDRVAELLRATDVLQEATLKSGAFVQT